MFDMSFNSDDKRPRDSDEEDDSDYKRAKITYSSFSEYVETGGGGHLISTLSTYQKHIVQTIVDSLLNKKQFKIFIHAHAGMGKTYLLKVLRDIMPNIGKFVSMTALTGIAATLLQGRTIHSLIAQIQYQKMCHQNVIIIDEISMMNKSLLERLDKTLRTHVCKEKEFGGVSLVFAGDFYQLPPVGRNTSETAITKSILWKDMDIFHLEENMRVKFGKGDPKFAQYLLDVGSGAIPTDEHGTIELYEKMKSVNSISDLIDAVYPDIQNMFMVKRFIGERLIVGYTNNVVDCINKTLLEKSSRGRECILLDSYLVKVCWPVRSKSLELNSSPLYLKTSNRSFKNDMLHGKTKCEFSSQMTIPKNFPLMLTKNVDISKGFANGSIVFFKNLINGDVPEIEVENLSGVSINLGLVVDSTSETKTCKPFVDPRNYYTLDRLKAMQSCKEIHDIKFSYGVGWFPVKMSMARTVHKSQGNTVSYLGAVLNITPFQSGMTYTALSRCGDADKIFVIPKIRRSIVNLVEDLPETYQDPEYDDNDQDQYDGTDIADYNEPNYI
jgi:hypothetical protein